MEVHQFASPTKKSSWFPFFFSVHLLSSHQSARIRGLDIIAHVSQSRRDGLPIAFPNFHIYVAGELVFPSFAS